MQVIWCLKFWNMTKSGGGQSSPRSKFWMELSPLLSVIYAHGSRAFDPPLLFSERSLCRRSSVCRLYVCNLIASWKIVIIYSDMLWCQCRHWCFFCSLCHWDWCNCLLWSAAVLMINDWMLIRHYTRLSMAARRDWLVPNVNIVCLFVCFYIVGHYLIWGYGTLIACRPIADIFGSLDIQRYQQSHQATGLRNDDTEYAVVQLRDLDTKDDTNHP